MKTLIKIGDTITMSNKNKNHLGNDVCAYSGMKGTVDTVSNDGGFILNCGTSMLIVSMYNAYGNLIKGVWLIVNGVEVYHTPTKVKPTKPVKAKKKWYQYLFPSFN